MVDETGVKAEGGQWLGLLRRYHVAVIAGYELVRGVLRDDLDPSSAEVTRALDDWPGAAHVAPAPGGGTEVLLIRAVSPPRPTRWGLHGLLLALTLFTTAMAGSLLNGVDPLHARVVGEGALWWVPVPTALDLPALADGLPFALVFLGILFLHEMGHYAAARRHDIRVTPPFFIPFPAYFSIVGTLGAFIRLRGPIVRRSILFDVGAAGPFASLVASIPPILIGLARSQTLPGEASRLTPFVIEFAGEHFWIGTGALFRLAAEPFFGGALGAQPILLDPIALAGWLGLFVTCLNLMPVGQLDGGHILYALGGSAQRRIGRLFLVALIPLGALWWGWWLWAGAVFALSRGRIAHPKVLQDQVPLGPRRRVLAFAAIVTFLLTFTPAPLAL